MGLRYFRDEEGQALAIAAAGAFVLTLALALTIDAGYGFLQRRIAQNEADKVALEVGRLLATSTDKSGSTIHFRVTQGAACTLAQAVNARDQRPTPQVITGTTLALTFESPSGSIVKRQCPNTINTLVPQSTRSVRVEISLTYKTLLASVLGRQLQTVGATSRVAVAGAPYTVDPVLANSSVSAQQYAGLAHSATAVFRTWPLTRFFQSADFGGQACGPLCDPATVAPMRFATGGVRSSGVQLLDLSRNSSRTPAIGVVVGQLLTDAGSAGTATLADQFATPFDGALGLNTDWADSPPRPTGQPAPPTFKGRTACSQAVSVWPWRDADQQRVPPRPSCPSGEETRGDWIETVNSAIDPGMVQSIQALIASQGGLFPYSGAKVPSMWPGGTSSPNAGKTFGRAAVVWIYLWDCAQQFDGGKWQSVGNCATDRPDRVHLFSVVPVTFYAGLVSNDAIEGYWGGSFVDPDRCQTVPASCPPLTPVANSAFLVAENVKWDPSESGLSDQDEEGNQDDEDWWNNWWDWWKHDNGHGHGHGNGN
jgi:hypothetical protein